MIHGLLAVAFGIFTLATPLTDEAGFLLDGRAFAVLCLLTGAQVAVQALQARHFATGWWVLLIVGVHAMGAGVAFWTVSSLALPYALFWSIVSFLMLEGTILAIGLLWSPVYRMWGLLMGCCMFAAALIMMFAWLADPQHSFDIPDAGMGIAGLLYGFAVFVAAMQARALSHRQA